MFRRLLEFICHASTMAYLCLGSMMVYAYFTGRVTTADANSRGVVAALVGLLIAGPIAGFWRAIIDDMRNDKPSQSGG